MCGSFCTIEKSLAAMKDLVDAGMRVIPILSFAAASVDTRFGTAQSLRERAESICGESVVETLALAEPIGPKKLLDALVIAPCTGNTLAKLACGIADTPVTLAYKAHARNRRPAVIAVSTNDALCAAAKNIGELMSRVGCYFVPMSQDAPDEKPASVVAHFELTADALRAALEGRQLQPVIRSK